MDVQNIQVLVGSLGFPIVVAGYLLVKVVPTLDGLKDAVNRLSIMLEKGEK